MEWSDEMIVLAVRQHGETGAIVEGLTRAHGRHLGLVHGGASRSRRAMLQPGNTLAATWRARLSEHLGTFSIEPGSARAGELMARRDALTGLNAFAAVASAVLPEREPHAAAFAAGEMLLDAIAAHDFGEWGALYVRWEAGLLEELGFGLDLASCAATGVEDGLDFVSPRSGRAVSAGAAEPYRARMLRLPAFLRGSQAGYPTPAELVDGLRLTAHFLLSRVLAPHGQGIPAARARLDELAARRAAESA